jgi:predicted RNase H-like HicB family nuclease
MAVELSDQIVIEFRAAAAAGASAPSKPRGGKALTGLAVLQGDRWVAVSIELGTVAEGASADEALDHLESAVRDVIEIATEEGLPHGKAVPAEEIAQLILEHQGQTRVPVTMRTVAVDV